MFTGSNLFFFWFFTERSSQKTEWQKKEALIATLAAVEPLLSFINSALHQPFLCPPTKHSSPLAMLRPATIEWKWPAGLAWIREREREKKIYFSCSQTHWALRMHTPTETTTVIYSSMHALLSLSLLLISPCSRLNTGGRIFILNTFASSRDSTREWIHKAKRLIYWDITQAVGC